MSSIYTPFAFYGQSLGPAFFNATGGIITFDGDYKIHTFTSSSIAALGGTTASFEVLEYGTSPTNYVEVLVVAGGGGGGARAGGGGGGGGMIYISASDAWNKFNLSNNNIYTIRVGAGGQGAVDGVIGSGANGGDSSITYNEPTIFTLLRAKGGGGGGGFPYIAFDDGGENGGSGGGGQSYSSTRRGLETQTSQSGDSGLYAFSSDGAPDYTSGGAGGGGGGAGGIAPSGAPNDDSYINGADGKLINITGTPTYYAGGGGGADDCGAAVTGSGGLGGGGNGAFCSDSPASINEGVNDLGGGAGGGGGNFQDGAKGGSGIVIIRYKYQ